MTDLLDDNTRETVSAALLAYNAMETTKRRHFDFLNLIETKKKKFNLSSTKEESQLLDSLLSDHNQAVKQFNMQTQTLLLAEPEAHQSLFSYISVLNQTLNQIAENSGH